MKAPDLPSPREEFTTDHLARWPMGAERAELDDGKIVWPGEFDERDAVVAPRTFPGFRVRVEAGVGLIVARAPREEHEAPRKWTDSDGTQWHSFHGMVLRRDPGEQHWTLVPWTEDERRRNREQLTAYRSESWLTTVAEYVAHPGDLESAWSYLQAHPIFWSWITPEQLSGMDPAGVDEERWARIQAESWLTCDFGLGNLTIDVIRDADGQEAAVRLEHGPTLWPLDVAAEHRAGFRLGGTPSHDPRLDVIEPTWKGAVVALAAKVRLIYGDDRAHVPDSS